VEVKKCPYCGGEIKLVYGRDIYKRESSYSNSMFWACSFCEASVGCVPGSIIPLGRLANSKTKGLRIKLHAIFDKLWREHYMTRSGAYLWLSKQLNIPPKICHIALLSDENLILAKNKCGEYINGGKA
jgi:hypothetical protein